ncbi:glycosyltransferase family 9 protein [Streptomyces sp. NPDC056161]|uniref:glycosyltransferase family 9 protein n=1 Tax=Streptomyces sp. NPDC056161 TaxID=3345732 RepID=UPI0035DF0AD7
MPRTRKTVLVVRHNALGDLIVARPALLGLRRHYPDHRLVITCPSSLLPLADHLGLADDYLTETADTEYDPREHETLDGPILSRLAGDLSAADVVVALRVPQRPFWDVLTEYAPRRLVAYRHSGVRRTDGFPEFTFEDHILLRWRRMLAAFGIVADDQDLHFDPPVGRRTGSGHTLVHIGAGSPARRWPLERWAVVIRHLHSRGHHVLLTGSRAESADIAALRTLADLPPERDLAGTTDALELAALVGTARLLVCTDTGISQIATALRRPSVTLFGPTPPQWWGPATPSPLHVTLWKGRTGDAYADHVDPGLLDIGAQDVISVLDLLPGERA